MYFIETNTPDHTIVSSYVTEKQARRYGGDPIDGYLDSLRKDEHYQSFFSGGADEFQTVRTVYNSKNNSGLKDDNGRFCVYYAKDYDYWEELDFRFKTYSDANAAIKGPLSKIYNEMIVTEINPNYREEMDDLAKIEALKKSLSSGKMIEKPMSEVFADLAA